MANYSPMTKLMMENSVNRKNDSKMMSPFHSSSWIHQAKDVKKEPSQDVYKQSQDTKLKFINNYEIEVVYKINIKNYYKNVPIYHENRNKYIPKTKK